MTGTSITHHPTSEAKSLFTVEGRIEHLLKSPGKLNLMEDMQRWLLAPGVSAALAGQAGMLANSASLALYEGEDVEHFAFLVNGRLAVGTFEWIEDIDNGNEVLLVVSDQGGVLCVHALLRKSDQLLWMPYSIDRSRWGWIAHAMKLCGLILVLTWLMFGAFVWIDGKPPESMGAYIAFGGSFLTMLFVGFMSLRGMLSLGQQAEAIFAALGVSHPTRFNLKKYALSRLSDPKSYDPERHKKGHIFKFSDALAAHAKSRTR